MQTRLATQIHRTEAMRKTVNTDLKRSGETDLSYCNDAEASLIDYYESCQTITDWIMCSFTYSILHQDIVLITFQSRRIQVIPDSVLAEQLEAGFPFFFFLNSQQCFQSFFWVR